MDTISASVIKSLRPLHPLPTPESTHSANASAIDSTKMVLVSKMCVVEPLVVVFKLVHLSSSNKPVQPETVDLLRNIRKSHVSQMCLLKISFISSVKQHGSRLRRTYRV